MSEDQAVQIARAGVALTDEHEYRQAYRRVREALDVFYPLRVRIIQAWYAEHYPDLCVTVRQSTTTLPGEITPCIDVSMRDPGRCHDTSAIFQECLAYLASLEE